MQGDSVIAVPTVDFLSSTSFQSFWVTWANGVIQVGQGTTVGEKTFMTYNDPTPSAVNSLAITGWNTSVNGRAYVKVLPTLP